MEASKLERPRVFVANNSGQDFSKALEYGEIVNITRGFVRLDSLSKLKVAIVAGVHDSSPDDYLVLTGSPLICALAAITWFKKHKRIKLLDYRREAYREVLIDEDNLNQVFQIVESENETT